MHTCRHAQLTTLGPNNVQVGTWTVLPQMPPGLGSMTEGCLLPGNERVLVMGSFWFRSMPERRRFHQVPIAFHLKTKTWELLPPLPIPKPEPFSIRWNRPVSVCGQVLVSGFSVGQRRGDAQRLPGNTDSEEGMHHELLWVLDYTQTSWSTLRGGTAPLHNIVATPLVAPYVASGSGQL